MRQVKIQKLTAEAFRPYGEFYNASAPEGAPLGYFYADRVTFTSVGNVPLAVSTLLWPKAEKMIVSSVEYHDRSAEGIICLNDDVVIHVAPPSGEPVPELTEAFLVPKGTFVKMNIGVWHLAAMPVHEEVAQVMIVLAERTYKTDCIGVEYAPEDQMELVF